MKKLIIDFLRPYVLQIMKDHLKVVDGKSGVLKITIADDLPPDPTGTTGL